jgi:hypothetical protein
MNPAGRVCRPSVLKSALPHPIEPHPARPLPNQHCCARHRHIWIPKNPAESPVGLSAEISFAWPERTPSCQTMLRFAMPKFAMPHLLFKESSRGSRSPQCCCRSWCHVEPVRVLPSQATPHRSAPSRCLPCWDLHRKDAQYITPPRPSSFSGCPLQPQPQPQTGHA